MARILFLTNCPPFPVRDGQTRRTYHILKGLAKRHEVCLLYLDNEENLDVVSAREKHLQSFCHYVEGVQGPSKEFSVPMVVRILRSVISSLPYTTWRHFSSFFLERVHRLCEEFNIAIVHCDALPLAYTRKIARSVKYTLTDHDVSYLKIQRTINRRNNIFMNVFLFLESIKVKHLESRIFKDVDLGIVVSEFDREIFRRLCPAGKFTVVENGVEVGHFRPDHRVEENIDLVWVGGFSHSPNREAILYFLEAIWPVLKDHGNIRVAIVGGDVPEQIKKATRGDRNIEFLGYVDDPVPYIQRSKIFIVPILSGSGTRLKILEAMSVGKPVVTTTIGCEGIRGSDGVHFFVADTPKMFAERVILLLRDDHQRRTVGDAARKFVEDKYDWNCICHKISTIYQEMAEDAEEKPRIGNKTTASPLKSLN